MRKVRKNAVHNVPCPLFLWQVAQAAGQFADSAVVRYAGTAFAMAGAVFGTGAVDDFGAVFAYGFADRVVVHDVDRILIVKRIVNFLSVFYLKVNCSFLLKRKLS